MPNTPSSLLIPKNEWVNLNEVSGIEAETKVIINNIGANAVRLCISLTKPKLGLRLRQSSKDKLGIRINDNLTGLTKFNALVTGFVQSQG